MSVVSTPAQPLSPQPTGSPTSAAQQQQAATRQQQRLNDPARASPSPSSASASPRREVSTRCEIFLGWCYDEWRDLLAILSLRHNFLLRFGCVLLMLKCGLVAITGRGVVSIIQAIGGFIFSIEGFWGAVKYDAPTVKRFLIVLVCYFFVSVGISVINLETLEAYCATAIDDSDEEDCKRNAALYSYLLLGVTLGLCPLVFTVGVVFFLACEANETTFTHRRRKDGKAVTLGTAYEMAAIVDRMGFSYD